MLTEPYGTPIRAVSASTSSTAKDAVSLHQLLLSLPAVFPEDFRKLG
jgi:hypothetical protein